MKMHHIVYSTTCLVTSKWYIGVHSTSKIDDGYLGSGNLLKRSLDKYGKENHSRKVLFHCNSREEAFSLEKTMITPEVLKLDKCINLCEGGLGGTKKGHIPWNKGLKSPYSEDQLASMINNRKIKFGFKKPQTYIWKTPEGDFRTAQEAADHFKITKAALRHRVKSINFSDFNKTKINKG